MPNAIDICNRVLRHVIHETMRITLPKQINDVSAVLSIVTDKYPSAVITLGDNTRTTRPVYPHCQGTRDAIGICLH
jgi:hypothetical protein